MRVVLDLNVLVSGIISKEGAPGRLLALWRERHYVLVLSAAMLERLKEVLSRPQLQRFIEVSEREELVADLQASAGFVSSQSPLVLTSDPEDNIVLATAVAGLADMLVSGDRQHLLPLKIVQGIPIVAPNEAIRIVQAAPKAEG